MARDPLDLLYGSLDFLILQTLAWEPMHGYGVSSFIRQRTAGVLEIVDVQRVDPLPRRTEPRREVRGQRRVADAESPAPIVIRPARPPAQLESR